jgi:hypothetical protein
MSFRVLVLRDPSYGSPKENSPPRRKYTTEATADTEKSNQELGAIHGCREFV